MSKPTAKAFIPIARQQKQNEPQSDEREKVVFSFRLSVKAKKQLAILAAEEGESIEKLCTGAINDLFQKYGKGRIA